MGSVNPWEDSRFRGEEYYGWIKSLPADTLRRAAFQHGLLGPLGSDIMSELTALEASGAAKHNDRLLQHIIPHGAKSFQMFLGVLSELDYHLEVTKFCQLFTPLPALSGALSTAAVGTDMGRTHSHANSASKDSASVVHNTTTNVYHFKTINTSGGQQEYCSPSPDGSTQAGLSPKRKKRFVRKIEQEPEDTSGTGSPRQPVPPQDLTLTAASRSVGTPPFRSIGQSTSAGCTSDHGRNSAAASTRQTGVQRRASDPVKSQTEEATEMSDVPLLSAAEVAAEVAAKAAAKFDPWTHPKFATDPFHRWILTLDTMTLRNDAISHGLLRDQLQIISLRAERDPVVHNERLLDVLIAGGRESFTTFVKIISRVYPKRSEEFKTLLTPP